LAKLFPHQAHFLLPLLLWLAFGSVEVSPGLTMATPSAGFNLLTFDQRADTQFALIWLGAYNGVTRHK
jgi:hypothetical protein